MSTGITSPSPSSPALLREARSVVTRALALGAISVPVLGIAIGTVPALTGLALFAGLLFAVERGLTVHHPHPRLGAANRITLVRSAIACLIAARAIEPAPLSVREMCFLPPTA